MPGCVHMEMEVGRLFQHRDDRGGMQNAVLPDLLAYVTVSKTTPRIIKINEEEPDVLHVKKN